MKIKANYIFFVLQQELVGTLADKDDFKVVPRKNKLISSAKNQVEIKEITRNQFVPPCHFVNIVFIKFAYNEKKAHSPFNFLDRRVDAAVNGSKQ